MPLKIRDLVRALEQAGFVNRTAKGSHRKFVHPRVARPVVISGQLGDDARRAVKGALQEAQQ
ncbi:MAG: type II toxin-antitoxin system HicA family toxin [Gammaproteobacteria bacterium]